VPGPRDVLRNRTLTAFAIATLLAAAQGQAQSGTGIAIDPEQARRLAVQTLADALRDAEQQHLRTAAPLSAPMREALSPFFPARIVDRARIAGESHYGLARVFIVFRDVCVLPFAVRDAAAWLGRFRIIGVLSAAGALIGVFWAQWVWMALLTLLALFSLSNATNLARFVKAQAEPAFRIKEYR